MSHTSGTLMYWNTHSGFGEIELDNEDRHVAVYRADLLSAGVKAPQVGDRFQVSTDTDIVNTVSDNRWQRLFDFWRRDQ